MKSSTIQLLRFHFSFFLMPVYWLALSQTSFISISKAILIFVILHLLVYPASNGYNSYMDRDTDSVGGIKNPQQPTRELFYTSLVMDLAALLLSAYIGIWFILGIMSYISASRAYSYRGIRLKKYPIIGYLTVVIFQGAVCYFLVLNGCRADNQLEIPLMGMIAAALLIGGFYPLTQIYQHEQDKADQVTTISMLLGYTGTFVFTAVIYVLAVSSLALLLLAKDQLRNFLVIQLFFLPVLAYFFWWFAKVRTEHKAANFVNTMRMNILASACSNAAFISLFLIEKI